MDLHGRDRLNQRSNLQDQTRIVPVVLGLALGSQFTLNLFDILRVRNRDPRPAPGTRPRVLHVAFGLRRGVNLCESRCDNPGTDDRKAKVSPSIKTPEPSVLALGGDVDQFQVTAKTLDADHRGHTNLQKTCTSSGKIDAHGDAIGLF